MIVHSGGSKTLVSQYLGGAHADLLVLADANLKNILGEERNYQSKVFAGNRLVLVCSKERPVTLESLSQQSTTLALADPQSAPLGQYSEQALAQAPFQSRVVLLKDATAVLMSLRLGHADAAVVYASDLQAWPDLTVIPMELNHHDPIRYVGVLPEPASTEATNLYERLTSESGQRALREAGFLTLEELLKEEPLNRQ